MAVIHEMKPTHTMLSERGGMEMQESGAWVCLCGHEECASGHAYGPAVRDHYLLHFVVRGKGVLKSRNREFAVGAGEAFLICPEETTIYAADEEAPWEYYWVGFKGNDAGEVLRGFNISEEHPILRTENIVQVAELFGEMERAHDTPSHSKYILLAYLYLILNSFSQSSEEGTPRRLAVGGSYLDQAVRYISDNYAYDINVEDVAAHVGIDRTYLYRIFMEHIGVSPVRYLLRVRMERACELLSKTGLSVYEVSLSTGYTDTSHFSGTFKKYFGQSPTQYRRKMWS